MTPDKHREREESPDSDVSSLPRRSLRTERTVISFCFVAGGWALLDSGHIFWGSVCLVAALLFPALHYFLAQYQASLPARIAAEQKHETERLLEHE